MPPTPLVSIIINNYNYARYLGQAIDSALGQCYAPVEVIVVDDGSTDDSRQVMGRYAGRLTPVFKDNGGQASAFNAGFARSRGEVIIFLDADDVLCPHVAGAVVGALQANPGAVKVHFRLEIIDASGCGTGQVRPPWHQPLPSGDLRGLLRTCPDDIRWQPTSGNAFTASVLRRVFPVPEAVYAICADYYLVNLPPLFGTVVALAEAGGGYRVHGANSHHTASFSLKQTRRIITQTVHTHQYLKQTADTLGLPGFPADPNAVPALSFLAHRLVSVRLEPALHPIPADRPWALGRHGVEAALRRSDLTWPARLLRAAWFAAVAVAPKGAVTWLARRFFYPGG